VLRGGLFKTNSSPYSRQGPGRQGLDALRQAAESSGLPIVSEVMDCSDLEFLEPVVAAFQLGARNMQNYGLLQALGQTRKPVILKRGMAATVEEFLLAAEYLLAGGNPNVILCERGIRTFETATRFTLDLNAVALVKQQSHLPVLVDPSHGTGNRDLVPALSRAAAAVGADGLLVEVHPDPRHALSGGRQSLDPAGFARLMAELKPFVQAAGRSL
jgi:3-deoxy-7-phosphoheptulonate synthase